MSTRTPLHVAFFVGSDVTSNLLAGQMARRLIPAGYAVSIYFPAHRPGRTQLPGPVRRLTFYERILLNEHIYPFLDAHALDARAPHSSPQHLARSLGITVAYPGDINDTRFLNTLCSGRVEVGISIRCYQKFGEGIIGYFNRENGPQLWNLHPGKLPQYRGVMTCIRAMASGDDEHAYSLHVVDRDWDAGPVISMKSVGLDCSRSMLDNMFTLYPAGAGMLQDLIDRVARGERIAAIPQDAARSSYHSFPTEADLERYEADGLRLVDPDAARRRYLDAFTYPGTPLREGLDALLREQIGAQEQRVLA